MSDHKRGTSHSQPKELSALKKLPSKKAASRKRSIVIDAQPRKDFTSIISLAKRKLTNSTISKLPSDLKPMLATLVDAPFSDSNWQFELKLDGYRALAYVK